MVCLRLEKKVYAAGESAVLHVDVKNNSNVDIESFTVKVTKLLKVLGMLGGFSVAKTVQCA